MKRAVWLAICLLAIATEARAACTYTLTPTTAAVPVTAGAGTFTVRASSANCKWRAVASKGGFLTASPRFGTGSATITYRYSENLEPSTRTGTIAVQGVPFTVTQAGRAATNLPPTASAGPAQTVAGGSTVTLNGTGTDPEGVAVTYSWTQTAGPSVTLSNRAVATPTFAAPAATADAQTLAFQLLVNDGAQDSAPAVTTVTVQAAANLAPTADAGPAQAVAGESTVTLNGSGSDPEGRPITYRWLQSGGPAVSLSDRAAAAPTFVAPGATSQVQALTFSLVVNDGVQDSAASSTTVTIEAAAPPSEPSFASSDVGSVGISGSTTSVNGTFSIRGAGADIWGTADSFRFVYQPLTGDGELVARLVSMENTHAYAKAGLMVRAGLLTGSAHVLLSSKPNGELEFMTRAVAGGATSWLAGAAAAAPAYMRLVRLGSRVSGYSSRDGITWTLVGSATATLPTTVYVGLIVCSHDTTRLNSASFDGVTVAQATAGSNLAPTASAGSAQTVTAGSLARLYGSGTDPEGQPLTYSWRQTAGSAVVLSNPADASPTFVAPSTDQPLALSFELTVSDGLQNSQPSLVGVAVQPVAVTTAPTYLSLLPSPPSGGATYTVPPGGDLQGAINAAMPGDVIVLQAGATYSGRFVLPAKVGRAFVMIRSSATFPEGVRVTPTTAGLAKIVSPNSEPAMVTQPGANFYWLEGLEIYTAGGSDDILRLGDGSAAQNSLALVPHNLVVSHCYIHGRVGIQQKRGIALNSGLTYIADSHIDEIKGAGYDSQAIGGWNGPGPYRIYNNYLSAAGEVVMFGGDDPKILNLVPTDIVFKGNLLTRPTSWRGTSWTVKNLFELKNAQQVVIDGNVFEYHWQAAQPGPSILFTPRNQGGGAPWTVVRDIQFVNNRVRHVAAVFNILGLDNLNPSQLTRNILVAHNLFEDVSSLNWGGTGRLLLINGGENIRFEHNTVLQNGSSFIYAYGTQTAGFTFTSNIASHGDYGILGDGTSPGTGTLARYFPSAVVAGNLLVGSRITYPAGNYYPATMGDVGFVDLAGGNYRLAPGSPYLALGADGADPGADMSRIK